MHNSCRIYSVIMIPIIMLTSCISMNYINFLFEDNCSYILRFVFLAVTCVIETQISSTLPIIFKQTISLRQIGTTTCKDTLMNSTKAVDLMFGAQKMWQCLP